jgi:hypothetical protein
MIIQQDTQALNYVNAQLHPLAPKPGSYLECFLHACLRADSENYGILRPILLAYMVKYPADRKRLEMEMHDTNTHA